jgi:hypothetical protein
MRYVQDEYVSEFVEGTLTEMRAYLTDYHSCSACGCPVRYPLIARKSDMVLFQRLIEAAKEVFDDEDLKKRLLEELRKKAIHSMLPNRLNKGSNTQIGGTK